MIELTDNQLCEIARSTKTAEPGIDGYILPVAFARAVIAADRELQDARWLEELRAYALTVSNLREALEREEIRLAACAVVARADTTDSAAIAREMHPDYKSESCNDVARRVDECITLRAKCEAQADEIERLKSACDKMSESEMLAGNPNQCNYTKLKLSEEQALEGLIGMIDATLEAAPRPPAQPERKPTTAKALLEQVLDALEIQGGICEVSKDGAIIWDMSKPAKRIGAIHAIRAELAKPERRPMSAYCIAELRRSGVQNDGFTATVRAVEAFHNIKETK